MRFIKTTTSIAVFTITLLFTGSYAHSIPKKEPLQSPYVIETIDKKNIPENITCPPPPKTPTSLEMSSVYTNRSEGLSIVDPAAKEKYQEQIKDIELYEKTIARKTKQILQGKAKPESFCAIEWLNLWAKQEALLNVPTNFQGGSTRKWFLTTIASHYYLLKEQTNIPNDQKIAIENWIRALSKTVIDEYSNKKRNASRHNNHIYWAAWSVMISAVVLDDQHYFDWAIKRAKKGLLEIRKNGTLPRELAREARAFNYHVFSVAPLIMMAETAHQNDLNLYSYNNGALHRLVQLIMTELNNKQSTFTFLTGKLQDTKSSITPYSLAWLDVYNARFPSSETRKWVRKYKSMRSRRIGGDMTLLYRKN